MSKINRRRIGVSNKFINIVLAIISLIMIVLDALAIYDIILEEPDILYEISVIVVSIFVFVAIGIYIKQRKKKSTLFRY
jgi:hypothetical protein